MWNRYANYHGLALFYNDKAAFEDFAKENGMDIAIDRQEYEDLLYGTNADIYVPVWASACKGKGEILVNEDTLEVIKRYKSVGVTPKYIDGNPPDYAGEQLLFLETVCAWALNGSMDAGEAEEIIAAFTRDFLVDTLRPTAKAIETYALASMEPVKDWIEEVIGDAFRDLAISEKTAKSWPSFATKPGAPLPVEEPHKVSIASFSDCGGKCKMLATVTEGCVLAIEPDESVKKVRFTGCPRGLSYRYTFLTSKRLRYPMERIGERGEGRFRRIPWSEVVDKVESAIRTSKEKYGVGSRYVIASGGNSGAIRGDNFLKSLLALDGGYMGFYNFYSAAALTYTNPYLTGGSGVGNRLSSYAESKFLILWGINASDGHFGHGLKDAIAKAKENGAHIVSIDPINHDGSMTMADEWIPIKPSSDAALIDAMAYVIFKEGLQDQDFMDKYCIGFDEDHMPEGVPAGESYKSYLFGGKDGIERTPEWAEKITGIPAERIKDLAIEFATVKPAALLPGLGPQRIMIGEQVVRGQLALACMVGSPKYVGGSTGLAPLWSNGGMTPAYKPLDNPYPGEIPLFQWTRCVDRPETMNARLGLKGIDKLESGFKVLFALGSGIMLNQHSNINDTVRILKDETKLEFIVNSDPFMTPAARFSDIQLPAPSFFEVDNIMPSWSGDIYFLYNQHCLEPLFGCRFEREWIREVADKMGYLKELDQGRITHEEWVRGVYEDAMEKEPQLIPFDEFTKAGCMIYDDTDWDPLAFGKQIRGEEPFNTPSGKLEIFSKTLYDMGREDIPGTPGYMPMVDGPEDERLNNGKLQLISYHSKKRCHSQHDHNALLYELDPNRIWINPKDAEERGIRNGDMVEAFNDYGVIRLPAKVTDRIREGVITVSEGGWFKPDKDGADINGSINVLTSTEVATPLANANPQQTNIADVRLAEEQ